MIYLILIYVISLVVVALGVYVGMRHESYIITYGDLLKSITLMIMPVLNTFCALVLIYFFLDEKVLSKPVFWSKNK